MLLWYRGSERHGFCVLARPTASVGFHALSQDCSSARSGDRVYQTASKTVVDDAATSRSLVFIDFTRLDPKAVVDTDKGGSSLGLVRLVGLVVLEPRSRCSYAV